jgi:hypothetical protein
LTRTLGQQQRKLQGQGERQYLEEIAAGQKAQTAVLGEDRVFMFNMADKIVTLLTAHPEIVANQRWPLIVGGNSMVDSSAILSGLLGNNTGLVPRPATDTLPPKQP